MSVHAFARRCTKQDRTLGLRVLSRQLGSRSSSHVGTVEEPLDRNLVPLGLAPPRHAVEATSDEYFRLRKQAHDAQRIKHRALESQRRRAAGTAREDLLSRRGFEVLIEYLLRPDRQSIASKSIAEPWRLYITAGFSALGVHADPSKTRFMRSVDLVRLGTLLVCAGRSSVDLLWELWTTIGTYENGSRARAQLDLLPEVVEGLCRHDKLRVCGEFVARILLSNTSQHNPIFESTYKHLWPTFTRRLHKSLAVLLTAIADEREQALSCGLKPSYSIVHFLASLDARDDGLSPKFNGLERRCIVESTPMNLRVKVLCELIRLRQPLATPEYAQFVLSILSGKGTRKHNFDMVWELQHATRFPIEVYSWLARGFISQKRPGHAREVFEKLERMRVDEPDLLLDRRYFATLLAVSVELKEWDHALQIFGAVMEQLHNAANTPEAARSAAQKQLIANPPSDKTYAIMFNGVKIHGKFDVAKRILKLMEDVGVRVDRITASNYVDVVGQRYGVEAMLREYVRIFGPYPLKETGMYVYADRETQKRYFGVEGDSAGAPAIAEMPAGDPEADDDLPWLQATDLRPSPSTIVMMLHHITNYTEYIPHLHTLMANILSFSETKGLPSLQGLTWDGRGRLNATRRDRLEMAEFNQRVRKLIRHRICQLRRSEYVL